MTCPGSRIIMSRLRADKIHLIWPSLLTFIISLLYSSNSKTKTWFRSRSNNLPPLKAVTKLWRKWSLLWNKMLWNAKNGFTRDSQLVGKRNRLRKVKNRQKPWNLRAPRSKKRYQRRFSKNEKLHQGQLRTKNFQTNLYLKVRLPGQ